MRSKVEILAPVGSLEALQAAVENGADAVYLGGKVFNARQNAPNFDYDELKTSVDYAHLRNVRVYVTVNILLDNKELNQVVDYILYLYNIGVDAVIIQDIGVVRIIKNLLPEFEIHASTQMTINNYKGVQFLEEQGFKRVVLARELSVDDISFIKNRTNLQLEGFIHGALCISYSGQCLLSSIIGGRSGNRGRCAQPCRMSYTIVNTSNGEEVKKEYSNKYLLSPKDLNTIDYLKAIIQSGITSLKIEGRMKRPQYVALIVNAYRKSVDSLIKNEKFNIITERDKKNIAQIFNRGFTKGFILNYDNERFISYDKPNNRGIYIGKVIKIDSQYIHILLEDDLYKGDGIEIDLGSDKNPGMAVDKIYIENNVVHKAYKGDVIKVPRKKSINIKGDVYKTSDVMLLKNAEESYKKTQNQNKISINMSIEISIDNPIKLSLWDNENYVTVESEKLVEKGINISLTKKKIQEQMNKLGNTPYKLENIKIDLQENSMVSLSILNNIRRDGVEKLSNKRKAKYNRRKITREQLEDKISELFNYSNSLNKDTAKNNQISVSIKNKIQFNQLNLSKLDRIYIPLMEDTFECIEKIKVHKKEVFISIDRILGNRDFDDITHEIKKIGLSNIDGIRVANLGVLKFVKDNFKTKIHGDIGLNTFNLSTVKLFKDYGLNSITLSPELKIEQISKIGDYPLLPYEVIGYGYLPLMIMKYCPLSIMKECKKEQVCNDCRFQTGFGLKDRKGMIFALEKERKNTILYNCNPIMVADHINDLYKCGINLIRLDFTIEKDFIRDIQECFYDFAKGDIDYNEARNFVNEFKKSQDITKGHYYRGVF